MRKVALILAAWVCMAPFSVADITGNFVQVTSEEGFSPPTGFKTFDLITTTSTDWTSAQLMVVLTQGSIFQDTTLHIDSDSPHPFGFTVFPALRWDTYVTNGKVLGTEQAEVPGGAANLGGSSVPQFDTAGINLSWNTPDLDNIGTFSSGRFTFSENAAGTFKLGLWTTGGEQPSFYSEGTISAGIISESIAGDLDSDGFVGQNDLNLILGHWGQTVTAGDPLMGDPSGDGSVGQDDLNEVLGGWGQGTPSVEAVPEPTTIALLAVGIVGAGVGYTRRRKSAA